MPLPIPKKRETEEEFIKRCMADEVMKREFKKNKQRLAVCYSQFRKYK